MEEDRRKYSLLALLLTLLVTVGTLALLWYSSLRCQYSPNPGTLAQLKQDSIMFGGEFVQLGNTLDFMDDEFMDDEAANDPAAAEEGDEPDIEGDDMEDAGPANQHTPALVTQEEESPHKVKKEEPKPEEPKKPAGPSKENDKKVTKPQAKVKDTDVKETKTKKADDNKTTTVASATSNRVKNAFGNGTGTGAGKQGSPNGNATQGVLAGKPSVGGLVGYTLDYWAKPNPNSKWSGKVSVRVNVNPRGQVTQAKVVSTTGEIASHPEMRRACEQAALKSSFSVPKNTTTEGIGTITYIWR